MQRRLEALLSDHIHAELTGEIAGIGALAGAGGSVEAERQGKIVGALDLAGEHRQIKVRRRQRRVEGEAARELSDSARVGP